jgi:hypothetical protein
MMPVAQLYDGAEMVEMVEMAEMVLGEADMSEEGMDGYTGNMEAE